MIRSIPTPALIAALVLHLIPLASRPGLIGGDEPHYAVIAHSIAVDGDVALGDDYDEVEDGSAAAGKRWRGVQIDRHMREIDGKAAPSHPLGLPILVAPFLAIVNAIAPGSPPDLVVLGLTSIVTFLALLAGWSLLIEMFGPRNATLVTFSVYFATPLWYTSRTFFAEPWIWAFAVIATALLYRDHDIAAGTALATMFWLKESSVLLIAVILVALMMTRGKERLKRAGIPLVVGVALWCVKNLVLFGDPFVTYQRFAYGDIVRGGWGVLFGVAHGILPFAPVAGVAILGWILPRDRFTVINVASLAAFSGTFVLTAAWVNWGGGSCFGPRLMVPAIAALAIPLATLLDDDRARGWLDPAIRTTVIVGFAIEVAAVTKPWSAFWSEPWPRLLIDQAIAAGCGAFLAAWILRQIAKLPDKRVNASRGHGSKTPSAINS